MRIRRPYALPYLRAVQRHGDGFGSLLWASPKTQRARFEAIAAACDPSGKSVLDVGCGRADYLAFLIDRGTRPADYIGIEMVEPLAAAAERRAAAFVDTVPATILRADFVRQPVRLFVGADIVVFSGSLNTLEVREFYSTIQFAFDAAAENLVFNFLSSSFLAGREYLTWHETQDVVRFAQTLTADVKIQQDYLRGDCTLCLRKTAAQNSKNQFGMASTHQGSTDG